MERLILASPAHVQVTTSCRHAEPHLPRTPHGTGHRLTLVYFLCSWLMKHSSPSERKSCILRPQSRAWPVASPPHLLKEGINAVSLSAHFSACKTLCPTPSSLMPSDHYTANWVQPQGRQEIRGESQRKGHLGSLGLALQAGRRQAERKGPHRQRSPLCTAMGNDEKLLSPLPLLGQPT